MENFRLKISRELTLTVNDIKILIDLLNKWALVPELNVNDDDDWKRGLNQYDLDIQYGVCSNIRMNLPGHVSNQVSSRAILHQLGIHPTSWPGWLPGVSQVVHPIAGAEEYSNRVPKWLLDTAGRRRRDFCVWVSEQLEIKLLQNEF